MGSQYAHITFRTFGDPGSVIVCHVSLTIHSREGKQKLPSVVPPGRRRVNCQRSKQQPQGNQDQHADDDRDASRAELFSRLPGRRKKFLLLLRGELG